MSTVKATLGRGIPLVDLDKVPAIPRCLVFQLGHKLTPSHITESFCQTVVLHHVLDRQRLNADRLVFTYQASRELVQEATASISDTGMYSGYFFTSPGTVLAALLFPGMSSLSSCQFLLIFMEELGVTNHLTRREDDELFQAQVSPNGLFNRGKLFDIFLYQERDKVAVCTVSGDGDTAWYSPIRQGAAPTNIQGVGHLCQSKRCPNPLESIRGVGSRLPITLLLEGGIPGTALEEIEKCLVQMSQCLLQGDRRHLREPGVVSLLLEERQGLTQVLVVQALLFMVEGIRLLAQGPIRDETNTAKSTSQDLFLLIRWVKSVLVCSFLCHAYSVAHCGVNVKQFYRLRAARLVSPWLKPGVLRRD